MAILLIMNFNMKFSDSNEALFLMPMTVKYETHLMLINIGRFIHNGSSICRLADTYIFPRKKQVFESFPGS